MVTSSERLLIHGPTAPTISRELNGDPTEAILGLSRPTLPPTGIPTGIVWNSLGCRLDSKRPRNLHLGLLQGRETLTA